MTDTLHTIALSLRDEIQARYPNHSISVNRDPDVGGSGISGGYDGWCVEGERFVEIADKYFWYNISVSSTFVVYHDSCTKRFEENICYDYEDPGLIDKLLTEIDRSVRLWPVDMASPYRAKP